MQLAGEPEQSLSFTSQEQLCNGIGCKCNHIHLEGETLKAINEVKTAGSLDFTSRKQVPDQSILGDKPGSYGYSNVYDVMNAHQNGHNLAPCSLPLPQFEVIKKETEFYMDKAVTEMELPKMIVCYKEGSYHIIKDICVDERLHSFDSVLVQNALRDEKVCNESKFDSEEFTNNHISSSLKSLNFNGQPIFDVDNEVTDHSPLGSVPEEGGDISHTNGETLSSETQKMNFEEILFPTQESHRCQYQDQIIDIHNENATQSSLASLLEEDRGITDTAEEIVLVSEPKEPIPLKELDGGHCHDDLLSSQYCVDQPRLVNNDIDPPKSINSDSEESVKESQCNEVDSHQLKSVSSSCLEVPSISGNTTIFGKTTQTLSVHDSSNRDQVDEGALEEANSTTLGVSSEELKEESNAKDLPSIGSSGGNIIAFDIDSEPPATIPEKDSKGTSEIQQSELVTNDRMLENASTDGPTPSSRTSFSHGHTDANFLGPAFLSGHIAYSGQVPYSGNISLRSDSSTTSTRSFAFPILQSEWNSSPVKMAKADRRHLRRHRGWRFGLLCCRF